MRNICLAAIGLGLAMGHVNVARSAEGRQKDLIYGRKHGTALTMDVFTPKSPNGKGVIFVVSGGWFSSPNAINPLFYRTLLDRGYTVFAVVHGSQPKFTVPEILEDMHRAVRFIRSNASKFAIDPDHLGIMGASAGGHLSLMMGTTGTEGNPAATDPVDRVSSKVQAVGAFCPPTDFLNWGKPGKEMIDRQIQPPFTAAMDYHEFDRKKALYLPIKETDKLREITRQISPLYQVKSSSAPTILFHGDKDSLVPFQQSQSIVERFEKAQVPVKLHVRKDAEHIWPTILMDVKLVADWFDLHLRKPSESQKAKPQSPG